MLTTPLGVALIGALLNSVHFSAGEREFIPAARQRSHVVVRILSMAPCDEAKGHFKIHNYTLSLDKDGTTSVSTVFEIDEDATMFTEMSIGITKCRGGESANNCEYAGTWKYATGVCKMMVAQGVPWSTVISAISPQFSCPLKKGMYTMKKGTINVKSVLQIFGDALLGNVWIGEARVYNHLKQLHICLNSKVDYLKVRG